MVDVFIRVFSSSELRLGWAIATVARWKMTDARVTVLRWRDGLEYDFGCDTKHFSNQPEFATQSLQAAEQSAQSDPYIICNDDNLIYGKGKFVETGLDIMERNPGYGCVSGVVTNGDQYKMDGPEITEIHAVGGLVFLRRNLVTEFPDLEDKFWDIERHRQVVAKGSKSGYARELPYLHMGAGFSIAAPVWFTQDYVPR